MAKPSPALLESKFARDSRMDTPLFSLQNYKNPYANYYKVRESTPIYFEEFQDAWMVSRYADVQYLMKRDDLFSSVRPVTFRPDHTGSELILLCNDAPDHTRIKNIVSKFFNTRKLKEFEPKIESLINSTFNDLQFSNCEAVSAITTPIPVMIIALLMGMSVANIEKLKALSYGSMGIESNLAKPDRSSALYMFNLFSDELDQRRKKSGEDFISILYEEGSKKGLISELEIQKLCMFLLVAGNETTTNLLSNTLGILSSRPNIWSQVKRNRDLLGALIEESLRFESPVQFTSRVARSEIQIAGRTIPAGNRIFGCIGAANRDPRVFESPEEFVISRSPNRHLSFSQGAHFCSGAALARLEATIILSKLLDRFKGLTLLSEGVISEQVVMRGYRELQLQFLT